MEVTKILLEAGAEVDAENDPGRGTTLGLVATSVHPLIAGVQLALLEALLDAGASVDGAPGGWNPLVAALHNGRGQAAAFLASRGFADAKAEPTAPTVEDSFIAQMGAPEGTRAA